MGRREERRTRENKERRTSGASHPATQQATEKEERYPEIEKDKSPEAKGSWDNLRKAGKKQPKLRPGIHNQE